MLWPGCCALPRQGWQAQGGQVTHHCRPPERAWGGLFTDTPYFVSPMPDSLLSTMLPWGAAWSS